MDGGGAAPVPLDLEVVGAGAFARVGEAVENRRAAEERLRRSVDRVHIADRVRGGASVELQVGEAQADCARGIVADVADQARRDILARVARIGGVRLSDAVDGDVGVFADLVDEQRRVRGCRKIRAGVGDDMCAVERDIGRGQLRGGVVGVAQLARDKEAAETIRNLRHVALQRHAVVYRYLARRIVAEYGRVHQVVLAVFIARRARAAVGRVRLVDAAFHRYIIELQRRAAEGHALGQVDRIVGKSGHVEVTGEGVAGDGEPARKRRMRVNARRPGQELELLRGGVGAGVCEVVIVARVGVDRSVRALSVSRLVVVGIARGGDQPVIRGRYRYDGVAV